ncbi:DUF5631 domain-containing protein [Mycolicibacterium palauense]|uniref:DUF5631 domain-containing protein n=1 Tax=Mycolicibacterium palauense TaxID=2034511 RepID=UPI001145BC89|nr:DUF5631 domain-containing protein [Mycolicibacterium palauense]
MAAYEPVHYIPDADGLGEVTTSIRARDTDEVGDLRWELAQATNWRDGLPRIAHTLAKAALAGSGILEVEKEQLRGLLQSAADDVLDTYPDEVDAGRVGNWQLLATISALAAGEKTNAHYHFAWFEALTLTSQGAEAP